eukprot:5334515-Alexandrium_andersonii.AAC.1
MAWVAIELIVSCYTLSCCLRPSCLSVGCLVSKSCVAQAVDLSSRVVSVDVASGRPESHLCSRDAW